MNREYDCNSCGVPDKICDPHNECVARKMDIALALNGQLDTGIDRRVTMASSCDTCLIPKGQAACMYCENNLCWIPRGPSAENIEKARERLRRIIHYSKENSLINLNAMDALQYLNQV